MSGGSYDYLCRKESEELLGSYGGTDGLDRMIDRLAGLGYAADAAREAAELQQIIRQAQTRVQVITDRLSGVFKAVEWWDSADSSQLGVLQALDAYRGAKACRACGCTDTYGCEGGCSWSPVDPSRCTVCFARAEARKAAAG